MPTPRRRAPHGQEGLVQGRTPCGVCPVACSAWGAGPPAERHHAAPGSWEVSRWTCADGKGNRVQPLFFFPKSGSARALRPPRGPREAQVAGMERSRMEGAMHACAEPREATTYRMRRRVPQNHRTAHAMSLLALLTAAVLLLADTCVQ